MNDLTIEKRRCYSGIGFIAVFLVIILFITHPRSSDDTSDNANGIPPFNKDGTVTELEPDTNYVELKTMSLNLRVPADPCPEGCWELRKTRMARMLEQYNPDLLGTQEGTPEQMDYFWNTLNYSSVGECAGDCWGNERPAIFYRSEKWQLLENKTFALSGTPEKLGSNTWDLRYQRVAVMARLNDTNSNQVVCILNTHFDFLPEGQARSAFLTTSELSKFCKETDSVVYMGDLNTWRSDIAIRFITGSTSIGDDTTPIVMYDAMDASGNSGDTWIGQTFTNLPWRGRIDYIFARNDPFTCLRDGTIVTDFYDGYTVSDHTPIMTTFCIGDGCSPSRCLYQSS